MGTENIYTYTSDEFIYRIEKLVNVYREVLNSYVESVKKSNTELSYDIDKLLTTHVNNKIRIDNSGNFFVKLPDSSKFYGDITDYKKLIGTSETETVLRQRIAVEFDKYLAGTWNESGKVFLYGNTGYAISNEREPNEGDVVDFLKNHLSVSDPELQNALVFLKDKGLNIFRLYQALVSIYKCSPKGATVRMEFPTPMEIKYSIDDPSKFVKRECKDSILYLVDFNPISEISFEDYKDINDSEISYFKTIINKVKVTTEVQFMIPILMLGYKITDQEVEDEIIKKFKMYMKDVIGVSLNSNESYGIMDYVRLNYFDEKTQTRYYFFENFIQDLLEPNKEVKLEKDI